MSILYRDHLEYMQMFYVFLPFSSLQQGLLSLMNNWFIFLKWHLRQAESISDAQNALYLS